MNYMNLLLTILRRNKGNIIEISPELRIKFGMQSMEGVAFESNNYILMLILFLNLMVSQHIFLYKVTSWKDVIISEKQHFAPSQVGYCTSYKTVVIKGALNHNQIAKTTFKLFFNKVE